MAKQKNYLVYEGDEEPVEAGSLREQLEKESAPEPETPKAKINPEPKPDKPQVKKAKKHIERALIGVIVVVSIAIAGILGVFFLANDGSIINVDQQAEILLFNHTAEYSHKITTYMNDISDLLVRYKNDSNTDMANPLAKWKAAVVVDMAQFSKYEGDYKKYNGGELSTYYTNRLLNISDMIDELLTSKTAKEAIDMANIRIVNEQNLTALCFTALKSWLDKNALEYEQIGDNKINLK